MTDTEGIGWVMTCRPDVNGIGRMAGMALGARDVPTPA
jgi:hypothetical protein